MSDIKSDIKKKPQQNASHGSSKKIVIDDRGKQYRERANVIKPKAEFTNVPANVVKSDIKKKPQQNASHGSSKNIKIVPDDRGKQYRKRANVIKPKAEFTKNDTANVVNFMAKRAKEFASRAFSKTVKIFKTANKQAIVPATISSDDAVNLDSIVTIFESNTQSKSGRKKGGKSRIKRTLKKRGGTRNSRQ